MRTAFIRALCAVAAEDPRVWLLTGDLGFSVLEVFQQQFPGRYINVGVAEQNMTGIAAGLALSGKTVFTYSIANFPTLRCLEQVRNDVCYHQANVKIVSVGGGYTYGALGYTHHGVEDLAIMRSLPGMTVIAPGDPLETQQAVRALAAHAGPAYLRLGKAGEPTVHRTTPPFAIGHAITVRDGADVTLVSTGGMLKPAMDAAEELARNGIQARVVSMHTIKPLDAEAIRRAARETRAIVTVEEHSVAGGLGSAVAEVLAQMPPPHPPFRIIGIPDTLCHTIGSQQFLRARAGDVPAAVMDLLRR